MEFDSGFEPAIVNDSAEVATWQRERSTSELLGFIARREAVVFDGAEVEDDLFAA